MYLGNFTLLKFLLMIVTLRSVNCINCYSCNSKQEKYCLDPFPFNHTGPSLKIVDCSNEITTRQFVSYFSNLMSVLGVSTNFNSKQGALNRMSEQNQQTACQKVEIIDNNERIIVRDCAILSDIVCDSLKNDSRTESSITFCEVCDSDQCNSSHKLFTSWNLLLMTTFTYSVIL